MNTISIDMGTTLTKIIECDEKLNIKNKMILKEKELNKVVEKFIKENKIDIKNIKKFVLTGVGESKILQKEINGIPLYKKNEFVSVAKGGLKLSKKEKAIIISMGTGTAFVRVEREEIKHLGGTGVGRWNTYELVQSIFKHTKF